MQKLVVEYIKHRLERNVVYSSPADVWNCGLGGQRDYEAGVGPLCFEYMAWCLQEDPEARVAENRGESDLQLFKIVGAFPERKAQVARAGHVEKAALQ
eukprot:8222660-Lingulodinium_polyedra.AAC.1